MSAPKHTPGPWQTDDREPGDQFRHVLDCGGHRAFLAKLPLEEVYEDKSFRDEQEANARLIAAAPELLAELRAAHQIINHAYIVMSKKQIDMWRELNALHNLNGQGLGRDGMRAAVIAKAGGAA